MRSSSRRATRQPAPARDRAVSWEAFDDMENKRGSVFYRGCALKTAVGRNRPRDIATAALRMSVQDVWKALDNGEIIDAKSRIALR